MYTDENTIKELIAKLDANTISESEFNELFEIVKVAENEEQIKKIFLQRLEDDEMNFANEEKLDAILRKILAPDPADEKVKPLRSTLWMKLAVAASILFAIAIGSYFLFFNKTKTPTIISQQPNNNVDPGKYKAKLTLVDGRTILLDSAAIGELAKQGNVSVVNKDGQLVYSQQSTVNSPQLVYNTLSTAKGETYSTILSDGTNVWLN